MAPRSAGVARRCAMHASASPARMQRKQAGNLGCVVRGRGEAAPPAVTTGPKPAWAGELVVVGQGRFLSWHWRHGSMGMATRLV